MPRHRRLAIRRKVRHGENLYFRGRKRIRLDSEIVRIESIGVPPPWTHVEIAGSASAKVLARGLDASGRTQAIYQPNFRSRQDRKKFDRMERFGLSLPRLRDEVDRDLRRRKLTIDLVIACSVRLLDTFYLRIGNSEYRRRYGSFGITTLHKQHVDFTGPNVEFAYTGKSGKHQRHHLRDARIVRILEHLLQEPGPEQFQYVDDHGRVHELTSKDVNRYLHKYLGTEFSAKDFRTWGGQA